MNAEKIPFELTWKVADYLLGTMISFSQAIEYFDINFDINIDENDLEDRLLDINVETCKGCEWWFNSCDLVFDETRQAAFCEQCEPELFE